MAKDPTEMHKITSKKINVIKSFKRKRLSNIFYPSLSTCKLFQQSKTIDRTDKGE